MESSSAKVLAVNLGNSLIVPSVQELAKEQLTEIPHRYIRLDDLQEDCPVVVDVSNSFPDYAVPVINIQNLLYGESVDSELEKLHSACKDWGFFQVVNHGVNSCLIEKIKMDVQNLFELPLEEKKKLWQQPGDTEGFGQMFVVSEEQKLDWSDAFLITTLPTCLRNPDLFAKLPLPFRDSLQAYSLEVKELAITILGRLAEALQMDSKEMKELFCNGFQAMRINYYPPCSQAKQVLGFSPHSDADALTIVLQINEMEGLQIRKDGKWISIKPMPDAFIVNVGDMIEIVSNGVYRSIEHRAVVNSTKERLSLATFFNTNLDAELGPALSLIDLPSKPALFRRVAVKKYFEDFFSRKHEGKSYLDFMRIENVESNNSS